MSETQRDVADQLNPYAATATTNTLNPAAPMRSYGGIGRLAYFGYTFLAGFVYGVATTALAAFQAPGNAPGNAAVMSPLLLLIIVVYLIVLMWIVAQRMINTGYNPWWCLGMFVPILNVLVGVRCMACPEGYADHRTLDTAGKIIVGLFFALFALVVLSLFAVRM